MTVFVSGCYDILHGGHIKFFELARSFGDRLVVCFASEQVLWLAKKRLPSIPDVHKKILIESLRCVDEVVGSSDVDPVFDFIGHLKEKKPDILVIEENDQHKSEKQKLCDEFGIKLISIPRQVIDDTSTTSIIQNIKGVEEVPLRVDFAGGWLDVPRLSKEDSFIVNCSITPKVSLTNWPYNKSGGLGGSAAYSILKVRNGVESEKDLGVGWQDPAVIEETGLCVWRSGKNPVLESKYNPDFLSEKMFIYWTGNEHDTPNLVDKKRDYALIQQAGNLARIGANLRDVSLLKRAMRISYQAQKNEGMAELPVVGYGGSCKYLGGGWGGYALYLFNTERDRNNAINDTYTADIKKDIKIIEPYIK